MPENECAGFPVPPINMCFAELIFFQVESWFELVDSYYRKNKLHNTDEDTGKHTTGRAPNYQLKFIAEEFSIYVAFSHMYYTQKLKCEHAYKVKYG